MSRALRVLVVTAVLATGCASRGTVKRLTADVEKLRAELTLARVREESTARELERIEAAIHALDARARELSAGSTAASEELTRLARRMDAADEAIGKTRALLDSQPPASAAPRVAPRGPGVARLVTPEHAYAAALATFSAREHGQAVLDFLDFIKKYPTHELAANAQYWIGEAYYQQRDYRQALLEFQRVLAVGRGKVPDALLKIGLCYWNLHESLRARATWQRVVREHPSAASAGLARALLSSTLRPSASPRAPQP